MTKWGLDWDGWQQCQKKMENWRNPDCQWDVICEQLPPKEWKRTETKKGRACEGIVDTCYT